MKMRIIACMAVIAALCGCARKAPEQTAQGSPAAGLGGGGPTAAKDIEAFGTVKARNIHTIALDFPAVLEKKLVSEGQRVKTGEVLFRFSADDYDSQISAKSLELESSRLELKKTEQERQRLEEDLRIALDDRGRTEKDLKAKQDLFAMGAVAQDDVDAAAKTSTAAGQRVRELTRSLEQYTADGVNGLEIQKARVANQERELERLRDQSKRSYISEGTIISDVRDGIVSEIGYTEGDRITRDRKLCSLMDLSSLVVEANVSEEFIKDIKLGSSADIVPLADNSRTYKARVTRVSGLAVKVNGETVVTVELALEKPDDFLRPNFNVDVKITL